VIVVEPQESDDSSKEINEVPMEDPEENITLSEVEEPLADASESGEKKD